VLKIVAFSYFIWFFLVAHDDVNCILVCVVDSTLWVVFNGSFWHESEVWLHWTEVVSI